MCPEDANKGHRNAATHPSPVMGGTSEIQTRPWRSRATLLGLGAALDAWIPGAEPRYLTTSWLTYKVTRRSNKSLGHLPWERQPSIKTPNSREAASRHAIPRAPPLRRLILLDGELQLGLGLKEISAIRYLIKCHLNYSNNPWLSDLGAV